MPPSPDSFALSNGITVLHFHKPSIPLVSITTLFAPGAPIDDPARPGLATLAADMLDEGAAGLDAIGFADAVSSLGATFDADASVETAHASMTVIKRNADRAIPLLADALIRPALQPEDWARVRTLHIENLRQQDDNPQVVAARVANRALFGDSSPYGRPLSGTRQSVESITIENVTSKSARSSVPSTPPSSSRATSRATKPERRSNAPSAAGQCPLQNRSPKLSPPMRTPPPASESSSSIAPEPYRPSSASPCPRLHTTRPRGPSTP
ncbi:MAG: insulinase family protein [Phycisphaeraceae bacterium]|nr:insulinase family protein [Phycisphaeraceae bacterium]